MVNLKMNASDFIYLLEIPKKLKNHQTAELKLVIDEFPYFQSARALYLKGLKNQESFKYNNELKITAAHTTDRTILFNFISSKMFNSVKKIVPTEEKKFLENKKESVIKKPFLFTSNESYSFSEWLQLSTIKPIIREETDALKSKKERIIDRFIQNNPKIIPVNKNSSIEIKITDDTQPLQLMTETLAEVYLEQKKYENAIKAYKILSLKYPKKSGSFADQIKRIQVLQKNK